MQEALNPASSGEPLVMQNVRAKIAPHRNRSNFQHNFYAGPIPLNCRRYIFEKSIYVIPEMKFLSYFFINLYTKGEENVSIISENRQ